MPFLLILIIFALAGELLSPGYILTLDLVWTPDIRFIWNETGFNNTAPVSAILFLLGSVIPSWIVQKIFLLGLFSALVFLPWKFLPFLRDPKARLFSTLLFVSNPFVYSRFVSGQWGHLFGYALLPLLLCSLTRFETDSAKKSVMRLSGTLIAIGMFSIHFLYLSLLFSICWIALRFFQTLRKKASALPLLRRSSATFLIISIASLYWILPAFFRASPIESRFNEQHFTAFAASDNNTTPLLLNVATGGGFWGEGTGWVSLFSWPQNFWWFWVSATLLGGLTLIGIGSLFSRRASLERFSLRFLLCSGMAAYAIALGAADTPFHDANLFLYQQVPGWEGLRDSHKAAGFLMLSYAVFGGKGAEYLLERIRRRTRRFLFFFFLLSLPLLFSCFLWGGTAKQLSPVWYPKEWYAAKALIGSDPGARILVLPWHGYLSLPFARERVVANPAARFFGLESIVQSRSVETGGIYDQETDAGYRSIDTLVRSLPKLDPKDRSSRLRSAGFTHILFLRNDSAPASSDGVFSWEPNSDRSQGSSEKSSLSDDFSGESLLDEPAIQLIRL